MSPYTVSSGHQPEGAAELEIADLRSSRLLPGHHRSKGMAGRSSTFVLQGIQGSNE